MTSPPAKYNIKGIVEINLNAKKGPSMGTGRENSVEKTTLSYIGTNSNVIIPLFSPALATTQQTSITLNPTSPLKSENVTTKTFLYNS